MKLDPRLLREAWRSRKFLVLSILLGLVGGIFAIIQARQISRIIDQVFLQGAEFTAVGGIFLSILGIMILRAILLWGGELSATSGARRIKQSLLQRLYTHITDIGPAFLLDDQDEAESRTGELANTAIGGIEALEAYFSQYLPQVALSALIPITILLFVFPSDLLSGVVLLVTAPLLPLFMVLIGSTAETLTRKQWKGLSRMSAYFLDVLQGLSTLKSLGRSREQVEVIEKVSQDYRHTTMGVLKVAFLSALVMELVATLSTAVVAVEIGIRLLYGKMAFEQAFFVLLLAPEFYLPLRLLGLRFHAGMAGVEAARRIFEILDRPVSDALSISPIEAHASGQAKTPPSITFQNVSFSYSQNRTALDDISFKIQPGKVTALVGESGAGKTTLTWLLLRFLQPQRGVIMINGKPLTEIPLQEWRDNLAWVSQNPYLFTGTVVENIKLARPDATEAAVQYAARLAHADEFIDQLPQGYATPIGERGVRLSAGQVQRVALARAFLKDAPLVILDEPTSHLDPETDAMLQDSLGRLYQDRSILVIAHHQSTLTRADHIVRLSHGSVVHTPGTNVSTTSLQATSNSSEPQTAVKSAAESRNRIGGDERSNDRRVGQSPIEYRLIRLLSPFTGRILLSVFLGFATIASSVGLMAAAAYIISYAALHPSIAELQVAIVGVRFFGLSRGVFRYFERLVSHDVTFNLLARWRVWFYQALEPLAPARLMQYHSGDLLSRLMGDIGTLEGFYVRAVSPPLVALLVAFAITGFMAAFGMEPAKTMLVFLLLSGIALPILSYMLSHNLGRQIIHARADLSVVMVDGIQGLPDLLTNANPGGFIERVNRVGACLTRLQARMAGLTSLQNAIGTLLANLAMLSVMGLAVQGVSEGRLDGVFIGVVALAALTSFEALLPLPLAAQNYEINRAAARRLYELVDADPAVTDPPRPLDLPEKTDLVVNQLSFSYPSFGDSDSVADVTLFTLENISFSLHQGEHIAIIGPSGAGKTTLINLLLRFWEYQHGSIQLGGNDLHLYRQEDIRKHTAIISQNTYLFNATIRENLLIAQPGATQDDMIRAAQAAQLHDMIQSLPEGYDTWIGEQGLRLSAGERQRLAVTRALLMDTPLLILDEPTANLDPVTELSLLRSIHAASQGRSLISITQRMVGLESMDKILVLKRGHLVEQGTHEELLSQHGLYAHMWGLYNQII